MARTGRPKGSGLTFTAEVGSQVCERLGRGVSLLSICEELGIAYTTAWRWMADPHYSSPEFVEESRRAREHGCHYLAEEAKRIADTPQLGELVEEVRGPGKNGRVRERKIKQADMIDHRRLQIDTRLRLIGKWLPKVYGDKQQLEHSGEITVSDRLARAEAKRKGETK